MEEKTVTGVQRAKTGIQSLASFPSPSSVEKSKDVTMVCKIYDKYGLKVVERKYNFKKTDGYNHLVAIDKIKEIIPNAPIPAIKIIPSRAPRLGSTVPADLRKEDDHSY